MHTPHQAGKRTCEDEEQLISFNLSHAEGKVGIKTLKKGNEIIAPLKIGKSGFAVADFGEGDEDTECPNLLLSIEPIKKKPASKRPASSLNTQPAKRPANSQQNSQQHSQQHNQHPIGWLAHGWGTHTTPRH